MDSIHGLGNREDRTFVRGRRLRGQRLAKLFDIQTLEQPWHLLPNDLSRLLEARLEVGVGDFARRVFLPVELQRHLHSPRCDLSEQFARLKKWAIRETEKRIHCDEVLQGPERCDALAGVTGSLENGAGIHGHRGL